MDALSGIIAQNPGLGSVQQNQMLSPQAMEQWQNLLQNTTAASPGSMAAEPTAGQRAMRSQAGSPISGMVNDFVRNVDGKLKEGENLRTGLLTGEPVNLHQATIALQEASVSFTLMMEFRNKIMEGYQELMRMQI